MEKLCRSLFILIDHYSLLEISIRAKEIYGELFRGQLNYFAGINFDEQVDFIAGFETGEEKIKAFLNDVALTGF